MIDNFDNFLKTKNYRVDEEYKYLINIEGLADRVKNRILKIYRLNK